MKNKLIAWLMLAFAALCAAYLAFDTTGGLKLFGIGVAILLVVLGAIWLVAGAIERSTNA